MRPTRATIWPLLLLITGLTACEPTEDPPEEDVGPPPCDEGAVEVCTVDADTGCLGFQTCTGGEFGPCEPPAEDVCDGEDDDCDGLIDETFAGLGDDCDDGVGECRDAGSIVCTGDGSGTQCDAIAGDPADEVCNGLDDDCDGATDEDIVVGVECDSGGLGVCQAGATVCDAGATRCEPLADPVDELCDGLDNDCDGWTDESAAASPLTQACYTGPAGTEGVGTCVGGTEVCAFGAFGACEGEVRPTAEICDGLDNDCNGVVDDTAVPCACEPGETQPCYAGPEGTEGVGACAGGTQTCLPGGTGFGPCLGQVTPTIELCDGIDQDCDGVVDDAAGVGVPCSAGVGACAVDGRQACDLDTGLVVCDAVAGAPQPETCNGEDDDCNGAVDDLPGAGEPCSEGAGACAADGFRRCVGDALVCDAAVGDPQPETCNGVDDDCNGLVDDVPGVGDACAAGLGACAAAGTLQCDGDGDVVCNAVAGAPQPETCNGVDDDCNGEVDDVAGAGQPCEAGTGACLAAGTVRCIGDALACDAVPGPPGIEICNGIDDDCNGIFEDVEGNGEPCTVGLGACAVEGIQTCVGDGLRCSVEPRAPRSEVDICGNGVDDDCDGAVDEGDCIIICNRADPDRNCPPTASCTADEICVPPVCDGLQTIADFGAYDGTNVDAPSIESPGCAEPTDGGEVAFTLDLGIDATICLDTFGSSYDTLLSARAACETLRDDIACDDDTDGLQSQIELNVVAGETYTVVVDARAPGDAGPFTLNVVPGPCAGCVVSADCPEGDSCVDGACVPGCESDADCAPGDLCRGGDCLGTGACPADDGYEDNERAPSELVPGRYIDLAACDDDIYIVGVCPAGRLTVDVYFTHDAGDLDVEFFPVGDSARSRDDDERLVWVNEDPEQMSQAWAVSGADGATNGYAMDVTIEGCDLDCADLPLIERLAGAAGSTDFGPQVQTPSCGDFVSGPEAMYRWRPDVTGTVCLDTFGSAIDTILSVRRRCEDLDSEIVCNHDTESPQSQVELEVVAGETYIVSVDSEANYESPGLGGDFVLGMRAGPCDVCVENDDCPTGVCVDGACAEAVCGDGFRGGDEQCDDGGTDDGDGCSAGCLVEDGFICTPPSQPVDDEMTLFGFTHCAPRGDDSNATGSTGLPQGTYRVYHVEDAISPNDGGTWRVDAELLIAGQHVTRYPQFQAGTRAGAAAAAAGSRTEPLRVSAGQQIQAYFADGFCRDNQGRMTLAVRSVDTCTPAPCRRDDDCAAGEACDAGDCRPIVCGDGITDAGEQCDDGNPDGGDGCSAGCEIEPGNDCAAATDEIFTLTVDARADCGTAGNPGRAVYTDPLPAGAYFVGYRGGSAIDDVTQRYAVAGAVVVEDREVGDLLVADRAFGHEVEADAAGLRTGFFEVAEGERIGVYFADIDCGNNRGELTFTARAVESCAAPECEVDADCAGAALCREGSCRAIGACPADDALEPNDDPGRPLNIEPGVYEGLASCNGSDDFYSVTVCAGGTLTVDVWFEHDDGNIALDVFPPMGPDSNTDDEQLIRVNEQAVDVDLGFWVNEITLAESGYAMRVAVDCGGDEEPEEPQCPDGTPLPACPDGFDPVSSYACERLTARRADDGTPEYETICRGLQGLDIGNRGVLLPGGTTIDGGFFGDGADGSRLNAVGVWTCGPFGEVQSGPLDERMAMTWAFQVDAPGEYVIGVSLDDFGRVEVDGQVLVSLLDEPFWNTWRLFPVPLEAGTHVVELQTFNSDGRGLMGLEMYGPFPAGSTADDEALAALDYEDNVLFDTLEKVGRPFDAGDYGYDCRADELLITEISGDPICATSEVVERCEPVLCPDGSIAPPDGCPVEPALCPDGSVPPACPDGFEADGTDCVNEERVEAQINGVVLDVCQPEFDPNAGIDGVVMPRGTQLQGGFFGAGEDSRIAATGIYSCAPGTDEPAPGGTPGNIGMSIPFTIVEPGFYIVGYGGGFQVVVSIGDNRIGLRRAQENLWHLGQLFLGAGEYTLEVELDTPAAGRIGAEVHGPFAVEEIISDEALFAADFGGRQIVSTIERLGTQWDYGDRSGVSCPDGLRYDDSTDPPTCFRGERIDNCPDVPLCPEGFPIPDCPEGYTRVDLPADDSREGCVRVEPPLEKAQLDRICAAPDVDGFGGQGALLPGGGRIVDGFFAPGPGNNLSVSGIWACDGDRDTTRQTPIDEPLFTEACLYIEQAGEYVVGAAGDDGYRVFIDNEEVLSDFSENERTFRDWTLAPVRLEAGAHVINLAGVNYGGPAQFGAQVYGPFPDGSTANDAGLRGLDYENNIVFSTEQLVGRNFVLGPTSGYYCPADLRLDVCVEDAARCVSETVGLCDIARGALCGNGRVELDEGCDDGNTDDGDGCSADCEIEPGAICREVSFGFGVTDSFPNNEADPNWVLSEDGLTIVQRANAEPATYSTSVPIEAEFAVTFDLSVAQRADDDLIGWTIGAGDTPLTAPDQPYLLFSWKQADQNAGGGFGFAPAGLRMGVVDGPITDIELWQFVDQGPLSGVQLAAGLGETGWEDNRIYRVELIGDADRLIVVVDGEPQFFVDGPLPTGNLGFYAYSQQSYTATLVSPLGLQICGPE